MTELLLQFLPVRVEYAVLFLTRVIALVSTSPFLGTSSPWAGYKIALGVALTTVLLPVAGDPAWEGPSLGLALAPLVARELFVGVFLGWILSAAFASVRAAGELVTGEMGLGLSTMLDPLTGTHSTVVSTLYQTIAGLVFVGVGAHRWVIAGLAQSFQRIPVGRFSLDAFSLDFASADTLVAIVTRFMEAGLSLAAPVLAAMFVVTVLLGVISRAVPQLNILDTGYSIRVLAALGALVVLLPSLRIGLESLFDLTRSAYLDALPAR
jgi:flagellar biosynthetic protein FliR